MPRTHTPRITARTAKQRAHRQIVLWIAPRIYKMQQREHLGTLSADDREIWLALERLQEYHERRDGVTLFR